MQNDFAINMDRIFESTSWFQFGVLILFVVLLLLGIKLLIFIFDNLSHQSTFATRSRRVLQFILDHIEPFIILILLGNFILINYTLHTLIVVLLVIGGYRQIRDYITGKSLKYNGALMNGSHISIGDVSGEIGDLRRLGVQVKAKDAVHFYSYARLYDKGFTIHANDAFGGYYPISVSLIGEDRSIGRLKSIIINSPYSDEFNPVRIDESSTQSSNVKLSVHLRKSDHLDHLKALLRFKGYDCN